MDSQHYYLLALEVPRGSKSSKSSSYLSEGAFSEATEAYLSGLLVFVDVSDEAMAEESWPMLQEFWNLERITQKYYQTK